MFLGFLILAFVAVAVGRARGVFVVVVMVVLELVVGRIVLVTTGKQGPAAPEYYSMFVQLVSFC
ncbi:MAG: hypothetical protein K2L99_04600, partial [Muribaculaceae bacterium]|nr:hypothetical protein [Muribaculaceae bacterium]